MAIIETKYNKLTSSSKFTLVKRPHGLSEDEIGKCINYIRDYFRVKSSCCLGYQVNSDFDYSSLFDFFNFNINNVGDPYIDSNYGINSRMMELPVIDFFAELFHALDKDYWGYIASGGTEANMYGMYTGRIFLESSSQPSATSKPIPIAYFSEDTHYSIRKALRMLKITQKVIPSNPKGAIQVPMLIEAILQSDWESNPPLIVVTMGTSFKGAYDDVEEIVAQLRQHKIGKFYIHVDAALGGLVLPFLENRSGAGSIPGGKNHQVPIFDFRLPIGSIAVSGHKVIGTPFPCAVFITLKEKMAYKWEEIDYIGSFDSTMSGSRNGLAAILLWYAIAKKGFNGLRKYALQMLEIADYATSRIQEAGFNAWKNDLGLSVVFDRPPDSIVRKWSLSTVDEYAHIFTMGHVNKKLVDKLAKDLEQVKQIELNEGVAMTKPYSPSEIKPLAIKIIDFNCLTDYALERLNSVNLDKIESFFGDLPADPYLEGDYRFRRLSRFQLFEDRVVKLPHSPLFQSKEYNPLLGDVVREFSELDDGLCELEDFQKVVLEFFDFCKVCSTSNEVGIHQIRTVASAGEIGQPAPEGIHRDGVDLVGIFCVNRERIEGGETYLYKSKHSDPIFTKILNPGELLVFNDHQFFHFTSIVNAISSEEKGIRDVFVLTCPGLLLPERR